MEYKITIDEIIDTYFTKNIPENELSEIPKGWQDGYTKGIIKVIVKFEGYQYIHKDLFKPTKIYERVIEKNIETDSNNKLVRKALESIEKLPYFIEWKM